MQDKSQMKRAAGSRLSLCMLVWDDENAREQLNGLAREAAHGPFCEAVAVLLTGEGKASDEETIGPGGVRAFSYAWGGCFAGARNYALSKAEGDFVLFLDPGERLLPCDAIRLRGLVSGIPQGAGAVELRCNLGLDPAGRPSVSAFEPRLFRLSAHPRFEGAAFEEAHTDGKLVSGECCITRELCRGAFEEESAAVCRGILSRTGELPPRLRLRYARGLAGMGETQEAIAQLEKLIWSDDAGPADYLGGCVELSFLRQACGDAEGMLQAATACFRRAVPNAEALCLIGEYHFLRGDWALASHWYEEALRTDRPLRWDYMRHDYWDYAPLMKLCLCAWNMGDVWHAREYNRRAGDVKPGDPAVEENLKFFRRLKR